jgi:hypothetical protein
MAEFKIDGRMTVRKLKENFKNEFEGTLRVYNGREKADDNATLASIRKNDDMKVGEYVCRASRTVGKFEKEMLEVFGIKVQVASPDDFVLALDGITLANLKNIKENATKADMEELVAYRRKARSEGEKTEDAGHCEENTKEDEKITLRKFIENVEFTIDYASSPAPNSDEESPEYLEWEDEIETIRFTIDPDYCTLSGYDMDECFWDSLCDCNDYMDYYNDYMYTNEEQDEEIEYTFDEISTLINGKFGECIIRAALNTGSMFIREIDFPVYNIHAELEYKDTKGYIYYERESIIEEVSFE